MFLKYEYQKNGINFLFLKSIIFDLFHNIPGSPIDNNKDYFFFKVKKNLFAFHLKCCAIYLENLNGCK